MNSNSGTKPEADETEEASATEEGGASYVPRLQENEETGDDGASQPPRLQAGEGTVTGEDGALNPPRLHAAESVVTWGDGGLKPPPLHAGVSWGDAFLLNPVRTVNTLQDSSGSLLSTDSREEMIQGPAPGQDSNTDKHAKTVVGKFRFNGQIKHYALVPPAKITSESELFDLLDLWELPTPNYLLETNQSEKRRDKIITKENASGILKQVFDDNTEPVPVQSASERRGTFPARMKSRRLMKSLVKKAKEKEAKQDDTDWTWLTKYTGQTSGEAPDWTWINRYLHRKTLCVLKSIASASDMVNGWFLCRGPPSSNEKMLEVAMDITGSAPTVLVVDSLDWYWTRAVEDSRKGSPAAVQYREKLKHTITNFRREKTEKPSATGTMPLSDALQNPGDYEELDATDLPDFTDNFDLSYRKNSVFSEPKTNFESALWTYSKDGIKEGKEAKPFSFQPKSHFEVDDIDGYMAGKWKARFPWARGTRFIFSSGFAAFMPSLLGPSGFLCMHGGTDRDASPKRTGYIIRESIDRVRPCILLDNTGAETQM